VPVKTGTADSHSPECVIPDDVVIQFGPPDVGHLLLETCRGIKINTIRKSASSWSLPRIDIRTLPFHVSFNHSASRSDVGQLFGRRIGEQSFDSDTERSGAGII
jgi:hypothetical protein